MTNDAMLRLLERKIFSFLTENHLSGASFGVTKCSNGRVYICALGKV